MKNIICIIIILFFFSLKSNGQFYFIEDNFEQIEVEFLKKKIEVKEGQTFFNVLKIKNPSSQKLTFDAKFSYPDQWTFMGDRNQTIVLNPSDSILIPYRAAPTINAKGEIGYAIVASLSDSKGKTFKTEYSFVNIPKITDFKFKPTNRVVYFDQQKNTSEISLLLSNSGNTDEFVSININLSQGVSIEGAQDGLYRSELTLDANTDTTISYQIKQNYINEDRKFHRVQIQATTKDTTFSSSVWAKELENVYKNNIPFTYKMLNIEAIAQNIFADHATNMNYHVYGFFLPKGNSVINYDYQTFGFTETAEEFWIYSRMLLQYTNRKIKVQVGDISMVLGHNMFGRGGSLEYKTNFNSKINLAGTKSTRIDAARAGASYEQIIKKNSLEIGGSYEENNEIKANSIIGFSTLGVNSKKIGYFNLTGALSQATWQLTNKKQLGYFTEFNYAIKSKKLSVNINNRNATKEYFGNLPGRTDVNGDFKYQLSTTSYLLNHFTYFKSNPPLYVADSILNSNINSNTKNKLTYNINTSPTILISTGPIYEIKQGNNFYGTTNSYLKTNSAFGYIAVRKRNSFINSTFNASVTGGYNWVSNAIYENLIAKPLNQNWLSAVVMVSYRAKIWGFSSTYYQGPYSINQQFRYYSQSYNAKNISLMPYLDFYVMPKYIRFATRPNYIYDIPAKTGRISINSELMAYPGREWELILSNTLNNSTQKDLQNDEKTSFSTSYFEFRVRKSFNFNQPKYQYHNLKIYFFKDLNGNNVKDADEPGVKDVLFVIQKDEDEMEKEEYNTASHFMAMDLLSDMNGYIFYENIPNGFYTIDYSPIGKMQGAFASENSVEKLYIDKDQIKYIPFHENNKIFGKAVLNRSKLSNLGSIDPTNIKVTAEDSKGKKYSTLTDANGNFTIYVPSVDKYKVKVNNIYFENFELEQNDYEVQLNGYRQFEVNFIFNEKRRKIQFTSDYEYGSTTDGPGIEIIRRTNLSGTIKDATTLAPIIADVRVVDKDGKEITSAKSSLQTGLFSLSFLAGDDYTVEVNADEYWFHAEKLYSQQIVTFKNLQKEILLKGITVGQFIPMKTLNFEAGSYEIPPTSFPELERLMLVLRKNPSVKIDVHGHADDLEILDAQVDLALERAKLVAKYLIAQGYNRVKYSGHSNTKPLADNETVEGRKANRRVEIVVTGK